MAYSDNDKKAKLTYLYVYMYLCATLGILYLLQKSIQWPDVIVVASDGNFFNWAQTRALNILELCHYIKDVTYLI